MAAAAGAPAAPSSLYSGALMEIFTTYFVQKLRQEANKWDNGTDTRRNYDFGLQILDTTLPFLLSQNSKEMESLDDLNVGWNKHPASCRHLADPDFSRKARSIMNGCHVDYGDVVYSMETIANMFRSLIALAKECFEAGQVLRATMIPTLGNQEWSSERVAPQRVTLKQLFEVPNIRVILRESALEMRRRNKIYWCSECQCQKYREDAQFHNGLWSGRCLICPERYWCLYDNCDFEHPGPSAKAAITKHFKTTHPQPARTRFLHCSSNDCLHPLYNVDPLKDSVNCLGCRKFNCLVANCDEVFPSEDALKNHQLNCRARRH